MKYMKYSSNICHKLVYDLGLIGKIDIIDLAIWDFIIDFSSSERIESFDYNGKTYFWIGYNHVINQLPTLGLKSKTSVYRRIKKLIEFNFLYAHPDNQVKGKTYFSLNKKYIDQSNFFTPSLYISEGNSTDISEGGTDEKTDYKDIIDKDIKDNTNTLPLDSLNNSTKKEEIKVALKKESFAEFVTMQKAEHRKLITKYGGLNTKKFIETLNNHKGAKGTIYKSDYFAILKWVVDAVIGKPENNQTSSAVPEKIDKSKL